MSSIKNGVDVTKPHIAYLLNYFPVLSETFIFSEIKNLKNRGVNIHLFSLFYVIKEKRNPQAETYLKDTCYIFPQLSLWSLVGSHLYFISHHLVRYFKTLFFALKYQNFKILFATFFKLCFTNAKKRTSYTNKEKQSLLVHFMLVMPFARKIANLKVQAIHAHLADTATSFSMLASMLCNVPYSFTTHATDLFVNPVLLQEKINRSRFVVTCTKYNKKYLEETYPQIDLNKVHVIYHGVDVDAFIPAAKRKRSEKPVLLTVGRLVKKKGLIYLLHALKVLKENNIPFQYKLIGDGPERSHLELFVRINQLTDCVTFCGKVSPDDMLQYYQTADMFVLPCVVTEEGDRDGIPNVIAEAMSCNVPVVASEISGIPELVINGETGLLVPSYNVESLITALTTMLTKPRKRKQMGDKCRQRVLDVFNKHEKDQDLIDLYMQQYALNEPDNN